MNELRVIAESPDLLPTRANPDDAGLDLRCAEETELLPGEHAKIRTGIRVDIPRGYVGLIRGRSGLADRFGIDVLAGVVDAGYHGEVCVILVNLSQRHSVVFEPGTRIAQLLIVPVVTPEVAQVEQFEKRSRRGEAGFGSSGQ